MRTYVRNCARCFGPFRSVNTHAAFPYEMCAPCQDIVFRGSSEVEHRSVKPLVEGSTPSPGA